MGVEVKLGSHIITRNLKKHYSLGEFQVKALDGIDLDIKRGDMVIIVGPSGSGKSTLVNMIGGVDKPDSGEVIVSGHELHKMNTSELTNFRKKSVGFVFQFYSLIPTLTAIENVEMAAELVNIKGKELKNLTLDLFEQVGLRGREKSYPSQLSGGERQRVALARAMAKRPELIVVDEPTGQLDEKTGEEMVKLIRKTSKLYGSTVLMVTHDQSLLSLGDHVIKMRDGKIIDVVR